LSQLLNIDPQSVAFTVSENGKPELSHVKGFHVNWSHSANTFFFGISKIGPIGVDIEFSNRFHSNVNRMIRLAARFFSPGEYAYLQSVLVDQQQPVFFKIWTMKEAYIKCYGKTVGRNLNDMCFSDDRWVFPNTQDRLQLLQCPNGNHDAVLAVCIRTECDVPVRTIVNRVHTSFDVDPPGAGLWSFSEVEDPINTLYLLG